MGNSETNCHEMTAREFERERLRFETWCTNKDCDKCKYKTLCSQIGELRRTDAAKAADVYVEFVGMWTAEHPEKPEKWCTTYMDDFLKYFPNVQLVNGVPYLCRKQVYGGDKSNCDRTNCNNCVACWNEKMEETY